LTDQVAQVRDDAQDVLRDMLEWSLVPARWADVEDALDVLDAKLDLTGPEQLAAFSDATTTLELSAPVRISRVDKLAVPVPDKIRERVNHLIHELGQPGDGDDPDEDSGTAR